MERLGILLACAGVFAKSSNQFGPPSRCVTVSAVGGQAMRRPAFRLPEKTFGWRESMKKYPVVIGILMVFALVALFAGIAAADRESIYERIHDQESRIHHGIRSGTLTRGEAEILRDNLEHIRHTFDRYKADGVLTYHEEAKLNRMLDDNSRMIHRMKENEQVRRLY